MKQKNICKFIDSSSADTIEVHKFIYETDKKIIGEKSALNYNRVYLTKSGKGTLFLGNNTIKYCPGMLIFGFEGESVYCECDENTEYMYIDFRGNRSDALFRRFGINPSNRCFEHHDGLIPLWFNSLSQSCEQNIDLAAESMLLYSLSRLSLINNETNTLINKILDLAEAEYTDPDTSISSIAKELNYNPKYLSHLFKEKMGTSFSEYLRNLRLKYAVTLLDHGIDSVKSIAFLCGFTDPLYFSSVFKKNIGVSPKEYKSKKMVSEE